MRKQMEPRSESSEPPPDGAEGGLHTRSPSTPGKGTVFSKKRVRSGRILKDSLFKALLAVISVVIVLPFFLILLQLASVGLGEVLGSGPGQGIQFVGTNPGPGLHGGILNSIVGSVALSVLAGAVGIPVSVLGAVYINEYTRPGRVKNAIEFGADVLAGIPSIVFGAFGLALLVGGLGFGFGLFSGGMTLAFMMMPTILRTTQEALRAVPDSLREASLALGATKWTTTWKVTIRSAFPGIVTGILLAFGRIIGETAPLLFTSGNSLGEPTSLFGPGSWVAALPYTIYLYISDPNNYLKAKAQGTAVILLIIVLTVDVIANYISRKVTRRLV